jgi:hypothetical protein
MKQATIMTAAAIVLMLAGILFFFLTASMTSQLGHQPNELSNEYGSSIGAFLFVLGLINFLARRSEGQGTRAIIIGTFLILIITVIKDGYKTLNGFYSSAAYGSLAIRSLFIIAYAYLLKKNR